MASPIAHALPLVSACPVGSNNGRVMAQAPTCQAESIYVQGQTTYKVPEGASVSPDTLQSIK